MANLQPPPMADGIGIANLPNQVCVITSLFQLAHSDISRVAEAQDCR